MEKLKGEKMVLTKRKWLFGKRLYIANQLCFEMSVTEDLHKAQIFYIDEPIDVCKVEDDFLFTRWRLKSFDELKKK